MQTRMGGFLLLDLVQLFLELLFDVPLLNVNGGFLLFLLLVLLDLFGL